MPSGSVLPTGCSRIDHQLDMQPIVHQQNAAFTGSKAVRAIAAGQRRLPARKGLVEELANPCHHRRAARFVIAAGPGRRRIERIGAVIGVIEAAPAGIGGVEQEPCVEHRHHQLRPGHRRDLGIDILRRHREGRRLGDEVADFGQEGLVFGRIMRLASPRHVPGIDLRLQAITLGQQAAVHWHQPLEQRRKALPELRRAQPQRSQHLAIDEIRQSGIDLQSGAFNPIRHFASSHIAPDAKRLRRLRKHEPWGRTGGAYDARPPKAQRAGGRIRRAGLQWPRRLTTVLRRLADMA